MKKFFYFLFISSLFIACSDDEMSTELPEETNQYKTGIDMSKSYLLDKALPTFENEVFHSLGYGYDITGKYAHPNWIRKKVLDPQKFEDDYYYGVMRDWKLFSHRGLGTITGTKEEVKELLLEEIKVDTITFKGYKNAFRDMFDISFENDTSFIDIKYYYAMDSFVSSWYEHYFMIAQDEDLLLLQDYLTDEFKADIKSKSARDIIQLYGTHVMVDIEVGWRQDYYYRSSSDNNLQRRMVYASAKFFKTTPGIWMEPASNVIQAKENIYTEYVSGVDPINEPSAWMFDITNYNEKSDFEVRKHTIDKENVVLVNWGKNNARSSKFGPIIPIYEFVSDNTKKQALKDACQEYLNK